MLSLSFVFIHISLIIMLCCLCISESDEEVQAIEKIFSKCKKKSPQFDSCIQGALNQLQPFFKRGIPEIGVAPFDPHFAPMVKQERETFGIRYTLILRDVYEKGWTQSTVTKYNFICKLYDVQTEYFCGWGSETFIFDKKQAGDKPSTHLSCSSTTCSACSVLSGPYMGKCVRTDLKNARIIYSQLFPEKSIEAQYEFKGDAFGAGLARSGRLSLSLRNYTQTTSVARRGAGVAVRVAVDRVGDLDLRLYGLSNHTVVERWLDAVIKAFWKPGFAVMKPAINDLVSKAFTEIWSNSFKNFNIEQFIKD